MLLIHHAKILKCSPNFGDASPYAPNTHTSFIFESHPNFMNKFIPKMHFQKKIENAFPEPAEQKKQQQ